MVSAVTASRLVWLFALAAVIVVGGQRWAANAQNLCAYDSFLTEDRLDAGCLTAASDSRPYFDTLVAYQAGQLCEKSDCAIISSDDTRRTLQNYLAAISEPTVPADIPPNSLPTSLFLWERSHRLDATSQADLIGRHRALAVTVDDQWLYDWQSGVAYLDHGRRLYAAESYAAALTAFETSRDRLQETPSLNPNHLVTAWAGIATTAAQLGDLDLATAAIDAAYQLAPDDLYIVELRSDLANR